MPTSIRTKLATPSPTTPRGLAYVPTHEIAKTLAMFKGMGQGVDEIPQGAKLACLCEWATSQIEAIEKSGKVVQFTHEKLERGNWKLAWVIVDKPKQEHKAR